MSGNINVYGLQSFTDASEAWKVMSNDFGSYEIDLQILNDNTLTKALRKRLFFILCFQFVSTYPPNG